jgi:hypothetical protein
MAQVDGEARLAYGDAGDQQLDNAGLLGRDERLPQVVELPQRGDDGGLVEIAMALHEELDDTHRAIKMAMRWTGASERTVNYWFSGERGPSGDHLIALARHSDAVLYVVVALAGRHIVEEADD